MAFFIHPNTFLVFFRDPEAKFTPEKMKQALLEEGVKVMGAEQPFALAWGKDARLTLSATLVRDNGAERLASRLMGRRRKYRDSIVGCDSYIQVTFEDLEELIDDMNTFIVVETALQEATDGLAYLSWNQAFLK